MKFMSIFINPDQTTLTGRPAVSVLTAMIFSVLLFPGSQQLSARESSILKGIQIPELQFDPPQIKKTGLKPYITLFEIEDNTLPVVNVQIRFEAGLNAEPLQQAGTLSALTSLLSLGGTEKSDPDEIASKLAMLGSSVKITSDDEYWQVTVQSLSRNLDETFQILTEMLSQPAFSEQRLGVIQSSSLTAIERRNERPDSIAVRKLNEALYYPTRLGYSVQKSNIHALTTDSIRKEYLRRISSRKMLIAVDGNYNPEQIRTLILNLDDSLPPVKDEAPKQLPVRLMQKKAAGKVLFVEKNVSQAVVTLGAKLPAHNHPDFYALQLANYILGGGSFNSWMMQEIRVKRGLAYYAYSRNSFDKFDGSFYAASASRPAGAVQTLDIMKMLSERLGKEISEDSLNTAKESILNSMVFLYEDPSDVLDNEMRFHYHDMPENYLGIFPGKLRSVTAKDVKRVAETYLNPDNMIAVVVGPPGLRAELEKKYNVQVIGAESPPEDWFSDSDG